MLIINRRWQTYIYLYLYSCSCNPFNFPRECQYWVHDRWVSFYCPRALHQPSSLYITALFYRSAPDANILSSTHLTRLRGPCSLCVVVTWSVGGFGSWFDEGSWRCDVANVFKHITSFIIHSHPDSPSLFFVFSSVRRGCPFLSRCTKLFNTFWFHVSYFAISNKSVQLLLFQSEGGGGAILSPADFDLSTCVLILNSKRQHYGTRPPPPPLFSLTIYTKTETLDSNVDHIRYSEFPTLYMKIINIYINNKKPPLIDYWFCPLENLALLRRYHHCLWS